jgi:hypothetical protein
MITEQAEIMDHVTKFYKGLFGPMEDRHIFLRAHFWDEDRKVKPEDGEQLVKMFTQEEVKQAMFGMKKDAAPSPNGFGASFFTASGTISRRDTNLCL